MPGLRSAIEHRGLTDWRLHALAAVVVVVACSPILTGNWVGGHDEYAYLWRAAEFRAQMADGVLWPRWCPHFFWGFGYPFFVFYPPGVFTLASAFGILGGDLRLGLLLTGGLGSAALFYGMRRLCLLQVREVAARFGATLATLATYRFVQLYVRGDQAEALATGLVPWVLAEALLLRRAPRWGAALRLAVGVAALSFTHTLTAVMTCGVLAVIGLSALAGGGWRAFARVGTASASGLVLSAAYWIPVVVLRPLVRTEQMTDRVAGSASYWWADHFPTLLQRLPGGFGFGPSVAGPVDGMAMSTSALGWAVGLLGLAMVVVARRDPEGAALWPWVGAWLALQALLLPVSTPIWSLLPGLSWFQFPWRFLLLELVVLGVIGAMVVDRIARRGAPWATLTAFALAVPTSWSCFTHAATDPYPLGPVAVAAMTDPGALLTIQDGSPVPLTTAGRNEYLPRSVERMPSAAPTLRTLEVVDSAAAWRRYRALEAQPGPVALPWFDFPGVRVTVDGTPREHHTDGRGVVLMEGGLARGAVVEVRYGLSEADVAGRAVSGAAWLLLGALAFRARRRRGEGRTAPGGAGGAPTSVPSAVVALW